MDEIDSIGEDQAEEAAPHSTRRPRHPGRKSVGWALVHAARLHRARLGDRLGALGLFPGQETVLQVLAAEEALSVGELAEVLRVRPPTASKAVSRLRALGLVERQARPGGGRTARVSLTSAGQDRAGEVEALVRDVERELLADFGAKDRRRVRKLLKRAAGNLVEAGAPEIADGESGEA